jgi:hypothetical protein
VPVIVSVSPVAGPVSSLTMEGEAERSWLRLEVDLGWEADPGSNALAAFAQIYLGQVRCRTGQLGSPLSSNLTWADTGKLACYFPWPSLLQTPAHHCVQVSLNSGRTFTTDCPAMLGATRAPVVTSFSPTFSLIGDSTTLVLSGVGFDPLARYWCLFEGPGDYQALQEATYRSGRQVECPKPMVGTIATSHSLFLSLYVSPQWPSTTGQQSAPLLVKRFDAAHRNWAYVSLLSVTPDRADSLGGSRLEILVENSPLTGPEHAALI